MITWRVLRAINAPWRLVDAKGNKGWGVLQKVRGWRVGRLQVGKEVEKVKV